MGRKPDFGTFSNVETQEVITEGLAMLTLDEKCSVIIDSLGQDEQIELLARLEELHPTGETDEAEEIG